jgi:hypothetical protein
VLDMYNFELRLSISSLLHPKPLQFLLLKCNM